MVAIGTVRLPLIDIFVLVALVVVALTATKFVIVELAALTKIPDVKVWRAAHVFA